MAVLSTLLIVRAGHKGFSTGAISATDVLLFRGFHDRRAGVPPYHRLRGTCPEPSPASRAIALMHRPSPCGVRGADGLDASLGLITGFAYAGMILATESWLKRSGIATPATRGAPVRYSELSLSASMGNRAGVTQHRTARRRDFVPHRVAVDISCGCSDHLAASHPPAEVEQGTGRAQGPGPRDHLAAAGVSWPAWLSAVSGAWAELRPEDRP